MRFGPKGLGVLLLLVSLALGSGVSVCDARSGKHWRQKTAPSTSMFRRKGKGKSSGSSHRQYGRGHQPSPGTGPGVPVSPSGSPVHARGRHSPAMPAPCPGGGNGYEVPSPPPPLQPSLPPPQTPPPTPPEEPSQDTVFNVLAFGAKGDGVTDDTQAFEAAWEAACKVEASTVLIPSELEFVVGPISFSGPNCKPNILFQLDGTIAAQTGAKAWGTGLLQWIEFTKLNGITIQGSGIINGRGQEWWTYSDQNDDDDDDDDDDDMDAVRPDRLTKSLL